MRIGNTVVSVQPSNDTISSVAADSREIKWQLHQIGVIARARRAQGLGYSVEDVRRDFRGKRVLEYADEKDLEAAINGQSPRVLAHGMIGRALGIAVETVDKYEKLARSRTS